MANIAFKKGLLANLPESYSEGTFYVTTDERALYLDVDGSTRIRIGDFQEFANLEALQDNTNPSTTALYYVTDLNVLAKWNGSSYVQINLDTGATSVEVVGDGNAVTASSYDPSSRKLTLTKGVTFATPTDVDSKISAKVGEIEGTVKAYVDEKTAGIASESELTELKERMTTAEGDIDALEELVGETAVATQIDNKIAALNLANTYEAKGAADAAKTAVIGTAEDASTTDTIKGAKKYAEEKATAAQTAAETHADEAIAALDVSDSEVATQVVTAVSETDGKISVTRRALTEDDIPEIAQSKVTGLTTALAGKQDTVVFNTAYNAESNKAATMTDVQNAVADLSGAMHYEGDSTTDPAEGEPTVSGHEGAWAKGDVVTYNAKEYVYDGTEWRELGDESSFAVKGSIKNADIAADAAIDQSKIAGLTDALAAKATPADITSAINGLDVPDEAESGKFVTAVVETDGKIAVSRNALVADDIPTLAIAKVDGLQDALDAKAVESDITDAIAALDVEDTAVDGQVVSAVSEADGKITVSRRALVAADIPELAQSKVTGLTTALAGKQDSLTFNTAYDASSNKAATMTDVDAAETAAKAYTDTALTWGSF